MKTSLPLIFAAIAFAPATAIAATPAPAEPAGATAVGEIIVTAQKRAENLQDVPGAVTAVSGAVLEERGIDDIQDFVSLVPNTVFSNNRTQYRITLRGLSMTDLTTQGGEARVAYHVNGVYLGMTGDIAGTFYDVERVEVNRGPQGTLFGRNSVAGTVNVVTRAPTDEFSGYLDAEIGNYSTANLDGAISGPLGEGISGRLAFQSRNREGYDLNVPTGVGINDQNTQAVRGTLRFEPTTNFTATFYGSYFQERDRASAMFVGVGVAGATPLTELLTPAGQIRDGDPRHNFSGQLPLNDKEAYGVGLDATIDLGGGFSLTSVTSFYDSEINGHVDTGDSIPLIKTNQTETAQQLSQEFRLDADFQRWRFTVGAGYYNQDYEMSTINGFWGDAGVFLGIPGSLPGVFTQGFTLGGNLETQSIAVFGQATFDITDNTSITVGARYTEEDKGLSGEFFDFNVSTPYVPNPVHVGGFNSDSVSYDDFSPRVTIEHKIGPDLLIYAIYAQGFKAGGFNVGGLSAPYLPEHLTNYEAGFKFDSADGRLRLNGAGFFYNYTDMQVVQAGFASNSNVNAGEAELYGVELELAWVPVDGLEFDLGAATLHSEFTQFDTFDPTGQLPGLLSLAGNRLPGTPEYTLSYGVQYTWDAAGGAVTARADGRTISDVFYDQFNRAPMNADESTILNASLRWENSDGRVSVTGFIRNITDELYVNGAFMNGGAVGWVIDGSYDPPRTYGVRLGVDF
ncbi:MAG: TonB-dependent receptor [Caulobacter sp.]|nr:TonB-dependent receptor [Caulobacter sp.]